MARVYATEQQLTAWLPTDATLPADPDAALRAASERVDDMLLTAYYAVDEDGMPTDAAVVTALMEATCAQAAYAMDIGDPYGTGEQRRYSDIKVGTVAVKRKANGDGGPGGDGDGRSSARAWRILQRAGLIPDGPWTWPTY